MGAVHRTARRHGEQRRPIVHRQGRQPSLRRPDRVGSVSRPAVRCRLRSDSLEDRYGQSALGRNLQQLQLSDLGQVDPGRTSFRSTPRSATPIPTATTQIEYGGWASPYTDNYDSDPLFTTSVTQGMVDRRAGGSSEKVGLSYTTPNTSGSGSATDAWYNYGNALAPENTNIWVARRTLSLQPYAGPRTVSRLVASRPLHLANALEHLLRSRRDELRARLHDRLVVFRRPAIFKYNRLQLEYDF